MPCTEQMIENAIEKSQSVKLNSFTASPNNVKPGAAVNLNWSITNRIIIRSTKLSFSSILEF